MIESNKIYNEDCIGKNGMCLILDESVDMILCDLPFGTTASQWDKLLDFKKLWSEYERIIKDNGAIVLFASGNFTHKLINSNEKLYKYKWIWIKNGKNNFVNAKNRPMTQFEEILIFSKGNTANGSKNKMIYYPQDLIIINQKQNVKKDNFGSVAGKRKSHKDFFITEKGGYPTDVLFFNAKAKMGRLHPNEKPIDLCEYLIKTYTQENEIVLDNCMGSGTTAIACLNTNRNYIGFEWCPDEPHNTYYDLANKRIEEHKRKINI